LVAGGLMTGIVSLFGMSDYYSKSKSKWEDEKDSTKRASTTGSKNVVERKKERSHSGPSLSPLSAAAA
jgi:hypothetical protein